MHDLLTVSLNKAGTIDHVINGVGEAVTPDRGGPELPHVLPVSMVVAAQLRCCVGK